MRVIYASKKGGKPLNIGMNQAKRVAHRADKMDRARIFKLLGSGLPIQAMHHQQLVWSRHRYYHDAHDEFLRSAPQKGLDGAAERYTPDQPSADSQSAANSRATTNPKEAP